MSVQKKITIIGAGVVGCAIAYELSKSGYKGVAVIEKNKSFPGLNQSSTNEGSIHSGIFYPKVVMPLKSRLCVEGNSLLYEFLDKYNLPYKKTGKLVVATNKNEEDILQYLLSVGKENQVPGIKFISMKQLHEIEPNLVNITAALYVPTGGSASPESYILKLKELATRGGVQFFLNSKVEDITPGINSFSLNILTTKGPQKLESEIVINSGGLYADEIARLLNLQSPYVIEPIRGEFYQFDKSAKKNIWMRGLHVYKPPYLYTTSGNKVNIIDVPVSKIPEILSKGMAFITVGTHLSPAFEKTGGKFELKNRVTISPLKTSGIGKEDYSGALHPPEDYIEKIHSIFPGLEIGDIKPDHTGIMSTLKGFRDFIIKKDEKYPGFISLLGMESPAWTASLAIARYVKNLL